ncbi:calcium-binding protein, partial [Chromobacterium vaccinii]|uniref:calcium-binding protein n=1 Tax=Chromobacterium vaccinii TaxID=1108595 RepID=UPI003D6E7C8D
FANQLYWIEQITFASGVKWTADQLMKQGVPLVGTELGDTLRGGAGNDVLTATWAGWNNVLEGVDGRPADEARRAAGGHRAGRHAARRRRRRLDPGQRRQR